MLMDLGLVSQLQFNLSITMIVTDASLFASQLLKVFPEQAHRENIR